jgi:hypothetical protein
VHRITVSLDALAEGAAGRALRNLLETPTDSGRITAFQNALRALTSPADHGPTQVSAPVRISHVTSVMSSDYVQVGDGARMNTKSRYVIEESELPIIPLLASDRKLVESFARALGQDSFTDATMTFLGDLAHACGDISDLDLIDNATDLQSRDALLCGLFGVAVVDRAHAVMIGSGNALESDMRVDRPSLSRGDLVTDIAMLSELLAPPATADEQAEPPEPPVGQSPSPEFSELVKRSLDRSRGMRM